MTGPNKLNNFLFQCHLYFYANPVQFDINIAKINFTMTYLTKASLRWASTRKTRISYKTGSLIGIFLLINYVDILFFQTLSVK